MEKLETLSGSVYQLDLKGRRVRRLSGPTDPTPRQGPDGEWKQFEFTIPEQPMVGAPLYFVWHVDSQGFWEINRGTMTSDVVSIKPMES